MPDVCSAEVQACSNDFDCQTCWTGADSSCGGAFSCSDSSDLCCMYGGMANCKNNALLLEYYSES